jgi:hypothetical protein
MLILLNDFNKRKKPMKNVILLITLIGLAITGCSKSDQNEAGLADKAADTVAGTNENANDDTSSLAEVPAASTTAAKDAVVEAAKDTVVDKVSDTKDAVSATTEETKMSAMEKVEDIKKTSADKVDQIKAKY